MTSDPFTYVKYDEPVGAWLRDALTQRNDARSAAVLDRLDAWKDQGLPGWELYVEPQDLPLMDLLADNVPRSVAGAVREQAERARADFARRAAAPAPAVVVHLSWDTAMALEGVLYLLSLDDYLMAQSRLGLTGPELDALSERVSETNDRVSRSCSLLVNEHEAQVLARCFDVCLEVTTPSRISAVLGLRIEEVRLRAREVTAAVALGQS